ncbi:18794_t:CDS:2, partial [Racocetra fulgida]
MYASSLNAAVRHSVQEILEILVRGLIKSNATTNNPPAAASSAPQPSVTVTINGTQQVYPALDQTPDPNDPEIQAYLKTLDLSQVPNLPRSNGGVVNHNQPSCNGSTQIAENQGSWTCQKYTAHDDIQQCPTVGNWGVTYDDGPSVATPLLLDELDQVNLKATFFVVGSRVVSNPQILLDTCKRAVLWVPNFDSNDWKLTTVPPEPISVVIDTFHNWTKIFPTMSTGFIVLQHDLYNETVKAAIEVLKLAVNVKDLKMTTIPQCYGDTKPYLELGGDPKLVVGDNNSTQAPNATSTPASASSTPSTPSEKPDKQTSKSAADSSTTQKASS